MIFIRFIRVHQETVLMKWIQISKKLINFLRENMLYDRIIESERAEAEWMYALQVDNVITELNGNKLLDTISFTIHQGEVLALVGHNGAGKSTLMKTLMHLLEKQSGTITIAGEIDQDEQLLAYKKCITYLPEEPMLLTELTVMQHFQMYALSYEIEEADFATKMARLVDGFGLQTKLDAYPEELSKGMRQKVQAICAFLPDVPVMLIDEPFIGLDIYAVEFLLTLLREKVATGMSIVLTTHQLEHVKDLADTFILLEHGKVKSVGPITEFDTITRGFGDD